MLILAALALAAPATDTLLACSVGAKALMVTSDGASLTYRFGPPARPEIMLTGSAATGNVFYHRTLYARGEDQTLRFVSGEYSYVVYSRWSAPSGGAEYNRAGVVVMKDGKAVAQLKCRTEESMTEWPVFKTLPEDADNRTPDRL